MPFLLFISTSIEYHFTIKISSFLFLSNKIVNVVIKLLIRQNITFAFALNVSIYRGYNVYISNI